MNFDEYRFCALCPRACLVDRTVSVGFCQGSAEPYVAHSMLHKWEEPCLSGKRGSGTVFFSGCPLKCVYCQNQAISRRVVGKAYSAEALASLYLSLEKAGAHNVNLVTAAHYAPHVVLSVSLARVMGLTVPVVYNTSGYESVDTLRKLERSVDIYLTDYRYIRAETAKKYSGASNYTDACEAALEEMVRQKPLPVFDSEGMLSSGVIVRLLLLPGGLLEAKMILKRVYERYGDSVYISLMSQYTPVVHNEKYPELDRRVSNAEYHSLVEYARTLGVKNAFTQEGSAASESFIPDFIQ